MEMKPIGQFFCQLNKNYDAPRQSFLSNDSGVIRLNPQQNFEQALTDLSGFSHIWLIYLFNNKNWKPKVQTPRDLNKKSVFATRSPYRPNPIGMSLVKLDSIDRLSIYVKNFDLLNETLILDIKPYLHEADSVSDSEIGWLADLKKYTLNFTDQFYQDLILKSYESPNKIIKFIKNQLEYSPMSHPNKRVKPCVTNKDHFILSYQYLRIRFTLVSEEITLLGLSDSREGN